MRSIPWVAMACAITMTVAAMLTSGCGGASPTMAEKPFGKADIERAVKDREIAEREAKLAERERKVAERERKQRTAVPPRVLEKPAIKEETPPPKATRLLTFSETVEVIRKRAAKLKADGIAEFEEKESSLSYDERVRIGRLTVRKPGAAIFFQDIKELRSVKLNALADAIVLDVVLTDKRAIATLEIVWDRSPKSQGEAFLREKMDNWFWLGGVTNGMSFAQFFAGELGRVSQLHPDLRKAIINFAGEEAVLNSP